MSQSIPQTPFRLGWYSFDLGQYRPCDGTYCLSAYEELPPLPAAASSSKLDWLGPLDEKTDATMQVYRSSDEHRAKLVARVQHIGEEAQRLGLTLPESFLPFMADSEAQDRIPSCTACYFDLSESVFRCPETDDGYLIKFLNDQQDVLLWYLYLTPKGEQCVLVSAFDLDEMAEKIASGEPLSEDWRKALINNTFVCAPTFEAFLYRFWLENTIWFSLNDGKPLTPEQQQYVNHYSAKITPEPDSQN